MLDCIIFYYFLLFFIFIIFYYFLLFFIIFYYFLLFFIIFYYFLLFFIIFYYFLLFFIIFYYYLYDKSNNHANSGVAVIVILRRIFKNSKRIIQQIEPPGLKKSRSFRESLQFKELKPLSFRKKSNEKPATTKVCLLKTFLRKFTYAVLFTLFLICNEI